MYRNNQKKTYPTIPSPAGLTEDSFNAVRDAFTSHFQAVVTPAMVITARKSIYSLIINGTDVNGNNLSTIVGTENAKAITETVINTISAGISTTVNIGVKQEPAYTAQ